MVASSSQVRNLWLRRFRDLLRKCGQKEQSQDAGSPSEPPADPVTQRPRVLGRFEDNKCSFQRKRPPHWHVCAVIRSAIPPYLEFPHRNQGGRQGKLWMDRFKEKGSLGREKGRNVPFSPPLSFYCAAAWKVEEAAIPVFHGGVFRDCS